MKKLIVFFGLMLILCSCTGDYVINGAEIIETHTQHPSGWSTDEYFVTVQKNQSKYTYETDVRSYLLANKGALVNVYYDAGSQIVHLTPTEGELQ